MITLSVIIPTQGTIKKLYTCLSSLDKQSLETSQFEVLLCLNNSKTKSLKTSSNQRCLYSPHGINSARNLGLKEAQGQFIYFLDDDCELRNQNFLEDIISFFKENPSIDGFGGFYKNHPAANLWEKTYNRNSQSWLESSVYNSPKTLFLLGGNFAIRNNDKLKTCFFDEKIPWGGSELSFFLEAAKKEACIVLNPEFSIQHNCKLSFFRLVKKLRLQSRRTNFYVQQGLLPRQEASVSASTSNLLESLGQKTVQLIFTPDKLAILLSFLLLPLRLIPRKLTNSAYETLIGYITIANRKKRGF